MTYAYRRVRWDKLRDDITGKVFLRGEIANTAIEIKYWGRNDEGKRVLSVTAQIGDGKSEEIGRVLTMGEGRELGEKWIKANPQTPQSQPPAETPVPKPELKSIRNVTFDDEFEGRTHPERVPMFAGRDILDKVDSNTLRVPVDADDIEYLTERLKEGFDRIEIRLRDMETKPYGKGWYSGEHLLTENPDGNHTILIRI